MRQLATAAEARLAAGAVSALIGLALATPPRRDAAPVSTLAAS